MNTQLLNTLTANSNFKSAAQASCKTMHFESIGLGCVLVTSWGYEQTNVDFYQVVYLTDRTVKLRKLAKNEQFVGDDRGLVTPAIGDFNGAAFARRYKATSDYVRIADRVYARLWNGKPQSFTCYG